MEDKGNRLVHYAGKADLEMAIMKMHPFMHTARAMAMTTKQETPAKQIPAQTTINTEAE